MANVDVGARSRYRRIGLALGLRRPLDIVAARRLGPVD